MPDTDAHVLMGILMKHNLTQRALAELTGISENVVSLVSCGSRLFTRRHITAICQTLKIDPTIFFPNWEARS